MSLSSRIRTYKLNKNDLQGKKEQCCKSSVENRSFFYLKPFDDKKVDFTKLIIIGKAVDNKSERIEKRFNQNHYQSKPFSAPINSYQKSFDFTDYIYDSYKVKDTSVRNGRNNQRQSKHASRNAFRSCSPSKSFSKSLEIKNNSNRNPFYIINGTSIYSNNLEENLKKPFIEIKPANSINVKHLNFVNKDLNGNGNPDLNYQKNKSANNSKENVLRDKHFVNHAAINLLQKKNTANVPNGFDTKIKKANIKVFEDNNKNTLNENVYMSIHHNTPEPLNVPNQIVNKPYLEKKNGDYYLSLMKQTELTLISKCNKFELFENIVPEEISGKIRSLIGNTQLLLTKKFIQFKNLCISNMDNANSSDPKVTDEDLAGFWDLILIQIDIINDSFQELETLKENEWKEKPSADLKVRKSSVKKSVSRSGIKSKADEAPSKSNAKSEIDKEMQRLRLAMMQGRTQRKHSANDSDEVQIYTK